MLVQFASFFLLSPFGRALASTSPTLALASFRKSLWRSIVFGWKHSSSYFSEKGKAGRGLEKPLFWASASLGFWRQYLLIFIDKPIEHALI
jgi:hypothetical protein